MISEREYHRRIIKRERLRSKVRRLENRIRRLYKFLRFCLVSLMLYGIFRLANAHYWYFPSGIMTEKNVKIVGNSIVSNKQIMSEINKVPIDSDPLYKVDTQKFKKVLEHLSPIKNVYIRRFWFPARIVVIVQEQVPAIVIAQNETSQEIAAYSFDGTFIQREYLPIRNKKNTIKILSASFDNWDKNKINDLYQLVKKIEFYSGEKVDYLDLRIPNNAFVKLKTVKVRLGVIDVNISERIKALSSIMNSNEIKQLSGKTKYIDLSWNNVRYINVDNEKPV